MATQQSSQHSLGIAGQIASMGYALTIAGAVTIDQLTSDPRPVSWLVYGALLVGCVLQVGLVFGVRLMRRRVRTMARNSQGTEGLTIAALLPYGAWQVTMLHGITGPYWTLFFVPCLVAGLSLRRLPALAIGAGSGGAVVLSSALAGNSLHNHVGGLVWAVASLLLVTLVSAMIGGRLQQLEIDAQSQRLDLELRIARLTDDLSKASHGNLEVHVADDDERLGGLGVAFNETLGSLRELVTRVRGGGEQIATSASLLLATAEDHAASASEQSSAVSETSATIEELASTAAQIAETSESVARYAAETLRYAEDGRSAVTASVTSMDNIAVRVDAIAARALSLGEKSHEIGRILDVIDDLADQTNLLALNAAIEAARAGEHGRGFAVVASEVRKLAERAQESTGQIQKIVAEIQAETNSTIIASEEGAKEVHNGTELARGVVDALERIAGMVDETTTAAKEISIATQQQRSASDQVVGAMTQVSDAARQYAVGSRESAAAAAQLNVLAAELRASIAQFQVTS